MKKFAIMFATVAAAMAFTSCETSHDDNPVLPSFKEIPVADYLNAPVMQDQYITLTEDDATGVLPLACSQPKEYGYAASVRYYPQVSLTKEFTDFRQLDGDWSCVCADINMTNGNVSEAICDMLGVKSEDDLPKDYFPLYVRLNATVCTDLGVDVPNTTIYSNVVEFKHVRIGYLAIIVPGVPSIYYMRGGMNEWGAPDEWRFVTTDVKNQWILKDITLAAGTEFKVADAKWGPVNMGAGDDNEIVPGTGYALNAGDNPGNLLIKTDFSGDALLTLKDGVYTLLLTAK